LRKKEQNSLSVFITIGGVHKGGVGKTTVAITTAHGLALAGYKVLVVDLDAQGHVAYYLGIDRKPGLYNLLLNSADIKDCITAARPPNLGIIPSDTSTALVEERLIAMRFREMRLTQVLEPLRDRGPDYVILDTAPGAGPLHDAAMAASDYVLAVVEASTASLDGLSLLTHTIVEFQGAGHSVKLIGIVPTMVDDRTLASQEALEALYQVEEQLAPIYPPVHRATLFQQAVSEGKTLWEMDPQNKSRATAEYSAVIMQLLKDLAQ
jgi:chromosome partitioning protein